MSGQEKKHRIIWLVRILAVVGLAMVVATTGLIGWTLSGVRHQRDEAAMEDARLDRALDQLRESASLSRAEIQTALDETAVWRPKTPSAATNFVTAIRQQKTALAMDSVIEPLDALDRHATHLAEIAGRATAWRTSYLVAWRDFSEQRTMSRVRQLISQLRAALEMNEGRRRLDAAIDYRRWRKASGEEAANLAETILIETAREESKGLTDFGTQLAEFARLVEALGGEEELDKLTDLKDNKLKPVLDRLTRSIGAIGFRGIGTSSLRPKTVDDLKTAIFGEGCECDEKAQFVKLGRGGLFALRRDVLSLRREREGLKNILAAEYQEIGAANADFLRTTQSRSAALSEQTERKLAAGWLHLLLFGTGCAALFFWLARGITHGIDGQVDQIEQARAEAEASRLTTQQLMLEQQRATEQLATAHRGLQASEERFRTLSVSAPVGIFLAEARGDVLYTNPMWETISGLSRHQALGTGWLSAVHPDDIEKVLTRWSDATRRAQPFDLEFRYRHPNGVVRWVHGRSIPVWSDSGAVNGHVGTIEDITARKEAEAKLAKMHAELLETSRQAGMAEVATSVLHNVGNVLNSVNVASMCVAAGLRKSKASSLPRVVAMMREHDGDPGAFFTSDPRAAKLPAFLAQLSDQLANEQATALTELGLLQKNIEHIKDIVAMQQTYAKFSGVTETLQIVDLIEDTLRMNAESFANHRLRVVREFSEVPPVTVQKHKVLQILVNLVRNAKQACGAADCPDKTLTLRVCNGDGRIKVSVADNGIGIAPENLSRIFNHGFTTKADGHGFGLHSGALAAREMGGTLRAESDGPGEGATFTLELPITHPPQPHV